jgi:guanylate kinase
VSDDEFGRLVEGGELLEWAEIVGHRSGTPAGPVEEALAAGADVLLEIDVKGAFQVRDRAPGAVLIFLDPPSLEELERRLRARGTEDEERLARRLETAAWELDQRPRFDHVVVNDDVERAAVELGAILDLSRASSAGTPPSTEGPSRP